MFAFEINFGGKLPEAKLAVAPRWSYVRAKSSWLDNFGTLARVRI